MVGNHPDSGVERMTMYFVIIKLFIGLKGSEKLTSVLNNTYGLLHMLKANIHDVDSTLVCFLF